MTPPGHQECPECGAQIPVHVGYLTWCDQCEWNLKPTTPDGPPSLLGFLYSSLGENYSRRLFEEFKEARLKALAPRLTAERLLAILLATTIHTLTLAFAILGGVSITLGWPSPILILLGAFCLLVAWVLRPRVAKPPRGTLRKDQCPALYQLMGSISDAYGGGPVPNIIVTGDFNALLSRVGWRNAKVLYIGLPLWVTLQREEKVALLAHELAHSANGDLTRYFFVGSAIDSLCVWYKLIHPDYIWHSPDEGLTGVWDLEVEGSVSLAMVPVNLFRAGVAKLIGLFVSAAVHLVWFDSQRAEYLADYLATTISGTDAMCSVLGKLHFGPIFHNTVDQAVRRRDIEGGSLLERFKGDLEAVPDRELQRIKRQQNLEVSRLDSTHPPTMYRIEFLNAHPLTEAKIVLSDSEIDEVDTEMSAFQEKIEHKILDAHRARLHYGS